MNEFIEMRKIKKRNFICRIAGQKTQDKNQNQNRKRTIIFF